MSWAPTIITDDTCSSFLSEPPSLFLVFHLFRLIRYRPWCRLNGSLQDWDSSGKCQPTLAWPSGCTGVTKVHLAEITTSFMNWNKCVLCLYLIIIFYLSLSLKTNHSVCLSVSPDCIHWLFEILLPLRTRQLICPLWPLASARHFSITRLLNISRWLRNCVPVDVQVLSGAYQPPTSMTVTHKETLSECNVKGNILKWMLNLFLCQRKITDQPPNNAFEINNVLATLTLSLLHYHTPKTLFLLGHRFRHYNFLTAISNLFFVALLSCHTSATAGICLHSWQSISPHIQ